MKLLVNGEIKELNIYNNGIDWSNDLIGNNTDWSNYKTDEETELKIVDEDFFDWWSEYIENYTADETEAENLARQFDVDISEIKEKIADNMVDCTDMEMEHAIKQNVFDEIRTSQAAAALGRKGGSVKSERKAKASAENGKLGGRPRKITNVEIAKEVCKAIPEADFEKVLKNIDIGRNQQDEAKFARKDIMQSYIDGFKESYEK